MQTNPIIRGFNPDPSIIKVGADYFIATSTFEWFPGVQIHHSKDLVHWELIGHPLNSVEKLNIKGVPDSCGVWAPCLSYDNGTFYLVYSAVKSFDGMTKDTPNYLITAKNINGPWSSPIFLDASGFDGSLFHDNDGRKYYLSLLVDHRKSKFFGGIILQEYDPKQETLIGERSLIFEGSPLGITEGPHLYKRDGYYYLLTAEGGTEYGHAISIARSKHILGPYELHPNNPLLSSRDNPDNPLQKVGHGDIVFDDTENAFIVFLAARPLSSLGNCTLGRESCIAALEWDKNKWPVPKHGSTPGLNVEELASRKRTKVKEQIDFSSEKLNLHYQSLRIPIDENWLRYLNGALVLKGREGLSSTFKQSLVARRVQDFNISYEIELSSNSQNFQQMAGLVCYYNTGHYYYLHIYRENNQLLLQLSKNDNFSYSDILEEPIQLHMDRVKLKTQWVHDSLQFFIHINDEWLKVGASQDAQLLSDDYVRDGSDRYRPAFTGSFVGIACQDLTGNYTEANFYSLTYQEYP